MPKKIFWIGFLAGMVTVCSLAFTAQDKGRAVQRAPKFGVVDLHRICTTVSDKGAIKLRFEKASEEYKKELESVQEEEKALKALQEEKLIFNPGSNERIQKEKEIQERMELLDLRRKQVIRARNSTQIRLENEIVEQVVQIVRKYAAEHGYDYIFQYNEDVSQGLTSLIFASKTQDVTGEVLKVAEQVLQ